MQSAIGTPVPRKHSCQAVCIDIRQQKYQMTKSLKSYGSSDLSNISQAEKLDWEVVISKIAKLILEEQSPAR